MDLDEGTYELEVEPGFWALKPLLKTPEGASLNEFFEDLTRGYNVVAGDSFVQDWPLELLFAPLAGIVRTEGDGEPIPGQIVILETGTEYSIEAVSDDQGRFELEVPSRGIYTVSARRQETTFEIEDVRPPRLDLELFLPPFVRLDLEVLDATTARAIENYSLYALPENARRYIEPETHHLTPGTYDLWIGAMEKGYLPRVIERVVVHPEQAPIGVQVFLQCGASVTLHLDLELREFERVYLLEAEHVLTLAQLPGKSFPAGLDNVFPRRTGLGRLVDQDAENKSTIHALAPGVYELWTKRPLTFQPSSFEVPVGATRLEVFVEAYR